jgi:hypothetical protein
MSTRATYLFKRQHSPDTCIYVHYDGYEAGAASYFAAMAAHPNHRGGLAERFIRAVDVAELTTGHNDHGDTEYRYTITEHTDKDPTLVVGGRKFSDPDGKWVGRYVGSLVEFINAHNKPETQDDTIVSSGNRLMRLGDALLEANNALGQAMHQYVEGWIGNASGSLVGIRCMIARLPMPHRGRLEELANKLDAKVTEAFAASRTAKA